MAWLSTEPATVAAYEADPLYDADTETAVKRFQWVMLQAGLLEGEEQIDGVASPELQKLLYDEFAPLAENFPIPEEF